MASNREFPRYTNLSDEEEHRRAEELALQPGELRRNLPVPDIRQTMVVL